MRWAGQALVSEDAAALPGLTGMESLARLSGLVRTVRSPEFEGVAFHEVLCKSALNRVPAGGPLPFAWTINPYRGCSHACVYCFARPSHAYLELGTGAAFDTEVIVKVNVAQRLREELARPSWKQEPVALGTNTDPYQRAEGRYGLMPDIIRALADSGTPLSILTKGTLLRRDLPLLASAAQDVPVELAMSIAVMDEALQATLEPGTPRAQARLDTVRAAREAGLGVQVFLMPVLPYLTDSHEALEEALRRIADAGATSVSYSALHLRPGVKEWFARWLHRHRPDLVPRYRDLYGDGAYAPREYRRRLAARVRPLIAARGLRRGEVQAGTGGPVVGAPSLRAAARLGEALPALEAAGTLF